MICHVQFVCPMFIALGVKIIEVLNVLIPMDRDYKIVEEQ